jgi:hypothetical protein
MKTDNAGTGIVGVRIDGPPVTSEADHFYVCDACGQAVDMRDLGQVFHHEDVGHKPIPLDDAPQEPQP